MKGEYLLVRRMLEMLWKNKPFEDSILMVTGEERVHKVHEIFGWYGQEKCSMEGVCDGLRRKVPGVQTMKDISMPKTLLMYRFGLMVSPTKVPEVPEQISVPRIEVTQHTLISISSCTSHLPTNHMPNDSTLFLDSLTNIPFLNILC